MPTLTVENVGPITHFEAQLPDSGLVVLRGPNGAGKTTVLHSAEVILNGNGKISKRDGAKNGSVTAYGKTLRVKQRTVHEGELEIEGCGDLSIADLHTPRFLSADARDRHRIKTLCRLAGAKADIELFRGMIDEAEFDRTVGEKARECTDLVEMAAVVKRDFEGRSRDYGKQAETLEADAKALRSTAAGIDEYTPDPDVEALQAAHSEAVAQALLVKHKREAAIQAGVNNERARSKLAELRAKYNGPTVEVAVSESEGLAETVRHLQVMVDELKQKLADATAELKEAVHASAVGDAAVREARQHFEAMDALEKQISDSTDPGPTDADLAAAQQRVADAAAEYDRGRDAAKAIKTYEEAQVLADRAKAIRAHEETIRSAAKECESTLSDAIAKIPHCPLKVWFDPDGNARIVTPTARDDRTLFDELSDGERWSIIVPLAAAENRLIVLPQAAYGELQPAKRLQLHMLARNAGCVILTAQSDDGPLRCEVYSHEMDSEATPARTERRKAIPV